MNIVEINNSLVNKLEGVFNGEIAGMISDETLDGLKKQLKDMGYEFYLKEQVQLSKVREPFFPKVSLRKKEAFEDISNLISEGIKNRKDWSFNPGEYTLYVANFRDNANRTYVLVENAKGDEWLFNVILRDNFTSFDIVEQPERLDSEALKHMGNQYKKVAAHITKLEFK